MISTRFARLHFARESLARAHFADHEQVAWQIRGAHRKPVAHGARDRRVIAIGQHRLGQHAARDFGKAHLLDGRLRIGSAQLWSSTHWRACSKVSVATTAIVPLVYATA